MPAARYWRIVAIDTYAGGDLELSEMHLYGGAARLDAAATIASTFAPVAGTLAALQDDDLASTCRFAAAAVRTGGFTIVWDFGADNSADVNGLRLGAATSRGDFLAGCTLQYSQDGGLWRWQASFSRYAWPGASAYTDAPVAAGDEYFGDVSLLLHMDGADGSTIFTDSSATPAAVTAYGNARVNAAQSKWGGGSLLLDAVGSYLSTPGDDAYVFGSGDFTLEAWIKTTVSNEKVLIDQFSSGLTTWQWNVTGGKLAWYHQVSGSGGYPLNGSVPVNDGLWHHVAAARASGVLRFFVDGVMDGAVVNTTNYVQKLTLGIGAQVASRNSVYDFVGAMDDVRVTKGVARYTENFTPPTAPFPDSREGGGGLVFLPSLLRAPASDLARIAAASTVPPHSALSARRLLLARDMEFGGPGRIWGTTKIETSPGNLVPTKSRVSILRGRDKLLAREVWSDPVTGEWEAKGLDTRQDFVVLAQDSAGNYQPVAADKTMPEAP